MPSYYYAFTLCSLLKREGSKKIAKKLLNEKLAVCVNIVPNIKSFYWWEGKIETSNEALLIVKTNSPYVKVKKRIGQLHSYEAPAIIALKGKVNKKYLNWSSSI